MTEKIDIAVIGGGPAGLTAALYAARGRAKTVVFERMMPGGQIVTTDRVENYPGFPDGLSGAELGELMTAQAEAHGAEIRSFSPVTSLSHQGDHFLLESEGEQFEATAVIVATGAVPRRLDVPGEAEYTGRGVSWCATCDGALYKEKTVAVIGGGDAAVEEAMFLTKFAARVHVIHRRDELRATKCIQERCFANDKIELQWNRTVAEVIGDGSKVTGIRLSSTIGEDDEVLPVDGVFIFVGVDPANDLLDGLIGLGHGGYVGTDSAGRAGIRGLFAAGDVTDNTLKQAITAAASGATAAFEALRYIDEGAECAV